MKGSRFSRLKILPPAVALLMVFCVCWARTPLKRDTTPIRPSIPSANRNEGDRVFLERADELRKGRFDEYQEVVGNVLFRKGGMYMYCDSALFFGNDSLEAFGNVRMEQGDTLFVYADQLVYGDSTQLATLYADPGKKVKLINRDVTLTTDIFHYDVGIELGYYEVGGTLWDKNNKLTSWYGEYSPSTKEANFEEDVHLESMRPRDTLDIYTGQMLYNTLTHVATLDTTSTIISGDGTIYTTYGIYNTDTQQADLYHRSLVKAKNGNTLTGDTLFYDRAAGYGWAAGNIELVDSANHAILNGDEGFYYENNDSSRVWGRALARQFTEKENSDTLYLHADTIRAFRVAFPPVMASDLAKKKKRRAVAEEETEEEEADETFHAEFSADSIAAGIAGDTLSVDFAGKDSTLVTLNGNDSTLITSTETDTIPERSVGAPKLTSVAGNAMLTDSVVEPADTTHYLIAAPHVRFYRVDLQGLCDSMTMVQRDSVLYLDKHPVVWSGERQIFGNEIQVHLNDSTADWARLPNFGFMAESIGEGYFSQLTGKEMFATFENQSIKHLDVSGNVQAIYLPMENDSTYNKIANIESSFMSAEFTKQDLKRLKTWPETSGTMTPLYLARKNILYLPQFRWLAPLRPKDPEDVFNVTQEMLDLMAEPPFGSTAR